MLRANKVYESTQIEFDVCTCLSKQGESVQHLQNNTIKIFKNKKESKAPTNKQSHQKLKLFKNLCVSSSQNQQTKGKGVVQTDGKRPKQQKQQLKYYPVNIINSSQNFNIKRSWLQKQKTYHISNASLQRPVAHSSNIYLKLQPSYHWRQSQANLLTQQKLLEECKNKINSNSSTTLYETKRQIDHNFSFKAIQKYNQLNQSNSKNQLDIDMVQTQNKAYFNIVDFSRVRQAETINSDSLAFSFLDSEYLPSQQSQNQNTQQFKQMRNQIKRLLQN